MAEKEKKHISEFIIPVNITQSKRILSFRIRNIIEGIIFAAIAGFIIYQVPFVPKVKIIVSIGVCGVIAFLNFIGIKGMSVTECFLNFVMYKSTKFKYHLRSIRYAKKQQPFTSDGKQAVYLNESLAEKAYRVSKEKIKELMAGR